MIQAPGAVTAPVFDPFQTDNVALPDFGAQTPNAIQIQPPPTNQVYGVPQPGFESYGVPSGVNNQWPYGTEGRNWWPSTEWPSQTWAKLRRDVFPRLLERPRLRHTFINGNNGNELGINESELATTMTFPNFLGGNQAMRLSPGFIFHFLDGPDSAVTMVDLPARVYSAYLGTDFISDPSYPAGMEANLTVGFYSDFSAANGDSVRVTATLLRWMRLNSYTTAKFGIEYFDRVDVKILPAVGVFLTPIADLKMDLYFPRPKLAQRVPNLGNYEVWVYVGGEYGGGSWTVERVAGFEDQVDINEVRSFVGAEWVGPRNVTGFLEFGYVFNRKLVYRSDDKNPTDLQDAGMVRLGVAF